MKKFSSSMKRCLALVLVLVLALSNVHVVMAAEETETMTIGKIIAQNYDLTDAEKALLSSDYLPGGTVSYNAPNDEDNLISVDTEEKKVTVTIPGGWEIDTVTIVAGGAPYETVTMIGGEGYYTYPGNAFSVLVSFVKNQTVEEDVQKTLLSTPGWLKSGVASIEALKAHADSTQTLSTLEMKEPADVMGALVELAQNGYSVGGGTPVQLGPGPKAAIEYLAAQIDANGGKLTLTKMLEEYASASSKVEYLLKRGAAIKAELEVTTEHIAKLYELFAMISQPPFVDMLDPSTKFVVTTLSSTLGAWGAGIDSLDLDWTAVEPGKGTALLNGSVDTVAEYQALDALVAALPETLTDLPATFKNPLRVASAEVQYNMSMYNVDVFVHLYTASGEVNDLTQKMCGEVTTRLTLAEGATATEILAAVAESGIVAAALNEWAGVYVDGQYVAMASQLPETLTEDTAYIITYGPVGYTVTYGAGFDSVPANYPINVFYGYKMSLPVHSDPNMDYDYTVNGVPGYVDGDVITIDSDVLLIREEGAAYEYLSLYDIVANNYAIEARVNILKHDVLLGDPIVAVRTPASFDALVSVENGILTAESAPSYYNGLDWTPYSYTTGGNEYFFTKTGNKYTAEVGTAYQDIVVNYRLTFSSLTDETAAALGTDGNSAKVIMALVEEIVGDARDQLSTLNSLVGMRDNISRLNKLILSNVADLSQDPTYFADPVKDAAMKALYAEAFNGIINNCFDGNNPKIAGLIDSYTGLGYYYQHSAEYINEVETLSGYLTTLLAEGDGFSAEEKQVALSTLLDYVGELLPDFAEDLASVQAILSELEGRMSTIAADLKAPHERINTDADTPAEEEALDRFALFVTTAVGQAASQVGDTDYPYLTGSCEVEGSGLVELTVKVTIDTVEQGSVEMLVVAEDGFTPANAAELESLVAAVLEGLGLDVEDYKFDNQNYANYSELADYLNETYDFSGNVTITINWTEKSICEKDGHDFSGDWSTDDGYHWKECQNGCGTVDAHGSHEYLDSENCVEGSTCTVCHRIGDGHSWSTEWSSDGEYHWYDCTKCDAVRDPERHDAHAYIVDEKAPNCEEHGYKNEYCSICGALVNHEDETTDPEKYAATGHTFGPWEYVDETYHERFCEHYGEVGCEHGYEKVEHNWDYTTSPDGFWDIKTCDECNHSEKTLNAAKVAEALANGLEVPTLIAPDGEGFVALVAPENDGVAGWYRYDYRVLVNGVATTTEPIVVENDGNAATNRTVGPYAANATVEVYKTLVNINNEKIKALLAQLPDAVGVTDADKKFTEVGYYTGIDVTTDMGGMMNLFMTLVMSSGYDSVELGGKSLIKEWWNEDEEKYEQVISLLDVICILMGTDDNALTSAEIIALGTGADLSLMDTTLQLSSGVGKGCDLPFTVKLDQPMSELAAAAAALQAMEQMVTFKIFEDAATAETNDLAIDVDVNLPDEVYQIYVAALCMTGEIDDIDDVNAVEAAVAYAFLEDYLKVLLGEDVSMTTIANTAAMLGMPLGVGDYSDIFNSVKGLLTDENGEPIFVYDEKGMSASLVFTSEQVNNLIATLPETGMVDEGMVSLLQGMILECKSGQTIVANLLIHSEIFADSDNDSYVDTKYEAIVINLIGEELKNMMRMAVDVETAVTAITGEGAVVLLTDAGDLVFSGDNIVLDLNGHNVNSITVTSGRVCIVDSSLVATECGTVGSVSVADGSLIITAGKYGYDIDNYLKDGYTMNGNVVVNELYTITKGQTDDAYTITLNSDFATRPNEEMALALALDLGIDLLLNGYDSADLTISGDNIDYQIYQIVLDDLLTLYTGENRMNAVIEQLQDCVDFADIKAFANDLLAKVLDFANADVNNLVTYTVTASPWKLSIEPANNGEYLGVSVAPESTGAYDDVLTLTVALDGELAQSFYEEMAEIASARVEITDLGVSYGEKALDVTLGGEGELVLDLYGKEEYLAVIAVALANIDSNTDGYDDKLLFVLQNDGKEEAQREAFNGVSVADFVAALKALNRGDSFVDMVTSAGLDLDTDRLSNMTDAYVTLGAAAGWALNYLDITGSSNQLMGALDRDGDGVYEHSDSIARSRVFNLDDYIPGGYTLNASVSASAGLVLTLFGALETYTVTWVDEDGITVLETDTGVRYGTMPHYDGVEPSKAADAQYTYTFDRWDPELAPVTGDVTYKATYRATANTYSTYKIFVTNRVINGTPVVTVSDENGVLSPVVDNGVEYFEVEPGKTVYIEAARRNNYVFEKWEYDLVQRSGLIADPTAAETSFVMPESNISLTAIWSVLPAYPVVPPVTPPVAEDDCICDCGEDDCHSEEFTDLNPDAWYHEYTDYVICHNLMIGVGNNRFEPKTTTTRAMIVTTLYRLAGCPEVTGTNTYTDVEDNKWYTDAVIWATATGLVEGYGNNLFGTNDPVTREQIIVLFYRFANFLGMDTNNKAALSAFPDADKVSSWAVEGMQWAVATGFVKGMKVNMDEPVLTLDPKGETTREQTATLLARWNWYFVD